MSHAHLIAQLENQYDAKVTQLKEQSFPVFQVELTYYPLKKTPMDILMKMMLISFQKAPIKTVSVLANILLVEPLFIEDLTEKMTHASLITKNEEGTFMLTEKGVEQLSAGIFEERLDMTTETLYYSAIHASIVTGDFEQLEELDVLPEPLDYSEDQITTINEENVCRFLENSYNLDDIAVEQQDSASQVFVSTLENVEIGAITDIPITLFILREQKTDRYFARVFNHVTNDFDEQLADYVTLHEKASWNETKN